MDLATRKIELINWISRQEEDVVEKVDQLRKSVLDSSYDQRMSETIEVKLDRSNQDIENGNTLTQKEVERHFQSKFTQ